MIAETITLGCRLNFAESEAMAANTRFMMHKAALQTIVAVKI